MKDVILKILLAVFFVSLPLSGKASVLYFDSQDYQLSVEGSLRADLLVDTQDKLVNAFEGIIVYRPDLLKLVDIKENNSIIDFWLVQPSADDNQGFVKFSGIIPGGYKGNRGQLFSLYFIAQKVGDSSLTIDKPKILLNDGLGTQDVLDVKFSSIKLVEQGLIPELKTVEIKDDEIPEDFWPIITQVPDIAGDKFVLLFSTKDKASGVDYYQVKEGWGMYKKASSPYVIKNQKLDVDIYVKAVDKNGNERVVKVAAKYPKSWYEKINFSVIIILILAIVLVAALLRKLAWSKTKNKKQK